MSENDFSQRYNRHVLKKEASHLLSGVEGATDRETARHRLRVRAREMLSDCFRSRIDPPAQELIRVRDSANAIIDVLNERSEIRSQFSVAQALWDTALGKTRDDLQPGFYAEIIQWVRGMDNRATFQYPDTSYDNHLSGRPAALARSDALDRLWAFAEAHMARFDDGLSDQARQRRDRRRQHILATIGGNESDWADWRWHTAHVVTDVDTLALLVPLSEKERTAVAMATANGLPFGVTPYYLSLMDDPADQRDRAIRAQVLPPMEYVQYMARYRGEHQHSCDFMLESDTSPVDLVTRRYPAIVILKPYNTCPQICVYCQRNWEISQPLAPDALADPNQIEQALAWIEEHSAIREVLITGGDPFMLSDEQLGSLLERVARLKNIDIIRLGTRTPVTCPMRITEDLAQLLGSFREIGQRDVAVVTHIEHPYEITLDTAHAVDRLRRAGISVYNQLVYTFFVSRRFENACLRLLLRRIGIDPYYTFVPKGKEETNLYRVPLARVLQEQKEEARLIPGLRRTDEAVFNVPGLGKNYIRARQHRDLLTVLPNGARVYEFHPWEKNIASCPTFVTTDVPILDYLARLAEHGENPDEYESIWYYF